MADNVQVTPGSGETIAADQVTRNATSEKQQIIKISLGAEGAFDTLVDSGQQSRANSLPVALSSEDAALIDNIEAYIDQIEGYIDGIEALLTTIDADTSNLNDAVARPSSASLSNVSSSATSVTLLSSNSSRKGAVIVNDSTQVLYLKFGTTASATSYTYKLNAGDTLELPRPVYTGRIDGIWASANGNARITEF